MKSAHLLLSLCVIILSVLVMVVESQRTALDEALKQMYRPLRLLGLKVFPSNSNSRTGLSIMKEKGKLQSLSRASQAKFCDAKEGPGRRSPTKPTSVHRLRPGDIDIIGALGDSLTAGNGMFAVRPGEVTVENRGTAFSIGGKGNWKKFLTLPNILKEFNPQLYGYATQDGLSTDRHSKFNVGELGAMSHDLPYMARVLWKRMSRDPKVNMTEDWKLITLLIGSNDLCSESCYVPDKNLFLQRHGEDLIKTFRFLRDNIPKVLLYVVTPPRLKFIRQLKGKPEHCNALLAFECSCIFGYHRTKKDIERIEDINIQMINKHKEIANLPEFNTETFTIMATDFTVFDEFPKGQNGKLFLELLSYDCFHLSQIGHAIGANALWNNFFERPENRSRMDPQLFRVFRCPSPENPYILTRENSKSDFII